MARIFTDGAEMGDNNFWDERTGTGSGLVSGASTTIKRSGDYGYTIKASASIACTATYRKYIPDSSELYFRCAFRFTSATSTFLKFFIRLKNDTTVLFNLYYYLQTLEAFVGAVSIGETNPILQAGVWYLIEGYLKIGESGIVIIKLDGIPIIEYAGNTIVSAISLADTIEFYGETHGNGHGFDFDDLALNDTTGSTNNSWCGDGRIVAIKPNANGDVAGLLNSAGNQTNNYTYVDDIPSDGDTTFVSGSEVDLYDLYNAGSPVIPTGYIPKGFWVEGRAKTTGSGTMSPMLKTSGCEVTSGSVALGYEYGAVVGDYYSADPITSGSWSQETLDAIQIGLKISGSGV